MSRGTASAWVRRQAATRSGRDPRFRAAVVKSAEQWVKQYGEMKGVVRASRLFGVHRSTVRRWLDEDLAPDHLGRRKA